MAKEATITINLEGLGNIGNMLSGLDNQASNASDSVDQIKRGMEDSAVGANMFTAAMGGTTEAILEATGGIEDLPDAVGTAKKSFEGLEEIADGFKESFNEIAGPTLDSFVSEFEAIQDLFTGEMGDFTGILDSMKESVTGLSGVLGTLVGGFTKAVGGLVSFGDWIIKITIGLYALVQATIMVLGKLGLTTAAMGMLKTAVASVLASVFSLKGLLIGLYIVIRTLGSIAAQTAAIIQGVLLTSLAAVPAGIAAITSAVAGLATTVGASMEESYRNVNEILANSNASLQNFHDMIIQIAADIPETGRTVSKVMRNVLKSGVRAEDQVRSLTETIIDLGRLSDQALSETSNQIVKISRAFGLLEGDATANVKAFADDLVTVRDKSVASIDELTTGLRKVAPQSQLLDLPIDKVLALQAGIQNAGMTARRAGTRMKRMLEELAKSLTDMEKQRYFATLLGLRPSEFEAQLQENFISTIREIGEEINRSSETAKEFADSTDQVGTAGAGAMAAISSNIDDINETIDELKDNEGSLKAATEEALGTFRKQLSIVADRIYLTGQAFGSVFVQPITDGLTEINEQFKGTIEFISRLRSELVDTGFAEDFYSRMRKLSGIDELFDLDLQGFVKEINKLRSKLAGPALGIAQEIGSALITVFNSTVWPLIKNVTYNIMRETAIIFVQLLIKSLYRLPNVLMNLLWEVINFFTFGLLDAISSGFEKIEDLLNMIAPDWITDFYAAVEEFGRSLLMFDFEGIVTQGKNFGIHLRASVSYVVDYANKAIHSLLTQLRNRLLGSAGAFVTKIARGLDELPLINVEPTVEMSVHTDVGKDLQGLNLEKLGLGLNEAAENIYKGAQTLFYAGGVEGEQLQGADLLDRLKEYTDLSGEQIVELYKPMMKLNSALTGFDYEAGQIKDIIKNILSGGTLKMDDMPEYSEHKEQAEKEVQEFMESWFMTQAEAIFDPNILDIVKQSFDRSADTLFEGVNIEQLASGLSGKMDKIGEEGKRLLKRGLGDNLYQKLIEAINEADKEMGSVFDQAQDQLDISDSKLYDETMWLRPANQFSEMQKSMTKRWSEVQDTFQGAIENNEFFLDTSVIESQVATMKESDLQKARDKIDSFIGFIDKDVSQMPIDVRESLADTYSMLSGEQIDPESRKGVKDAKEFILKLIDRMIPERKEWEERLDEFATDMQSDFAQGLSTVVFQDSSWSNIWESFAQTFSDLVFQEISEDIFEELGFEQAAKNIGTFVGNAISGFTESILYQVQGDIVENAALQSWMEDWGKTIGRWIGWLLNFIIRDVIINQIVGRIVGNQDLVTGADDIFKNLTGGAGGADGHFHGGLIQAFASGGQVFGESGIDRIPAMLTDGEYVMRRQAVNERTLPLLEQMNENPRNFAQGGQVGGSGSSSQSQDSQQNVNYTIHAVDASSFQQLVEQNPEAIARTVQKDISQNGPTRKAIQEYAR